MLDQIRQFGEGSRRFKKSVKKLPRQMRAELAAVVQELLNGDAPPGRHPERLPRYGEVYSVRLNLRYRLAFKIEDGLAMPLVVGTHDQVYAAIPQALKARSRLTSQSAEVWPAQDDAGQDGPPTCD